MKNDDIKIGCGLFINRELLTEPKPFTLDWLDPESDFHWLALQTWENEGDRFYGFERTE